MLIKKNKGLILGAVLVIVLITTAIFIYNNFTQSTQMGQKNITFTVKVEGKQDKTYNITTDEDYLGQALINENIIEGNESLSGMFVTVVDGIDTNDFEKGWWLFTKNDEDLQSGISNTPIAEGEHYEAILKIGY